MKSDETGLGAIADAFRYLKWIKLGSDDFTYGHALLEKYYICSEKKWNHSWEYLPWSLMQLILHVPRFLFFIKYAYKYFWKTTPNNDEQSYSSKNRYKVEGDSKALRGLCWLGRCFTQYNCLVILFPCPQCLIIHPILCSLPTLPSVKKQIQTKKWNPK